MCDFCDNIKRRQNLRLKRGRGKVLTLSLKADKYASCYTVIENITPNGKTKKQVIYNGIYYSFHLDDAAYKRLKNMYAAFAGLMLVCYFVIAFIKASSLGAGHTPALYTALPFVFLLVPIGMCAGKVFLLLFLPNKLEYPKYDKYVVHLKTYSAILFALCVATLVGQLAYLILSPDTPVSDYLFAVLAAFLTFLSVCFLREQRKYICTPEQ
jgi:hypothetical protein